MVTGDNVTLQYISSAFICRLLTPETDLDTDWFKSVLETINSKTNFGILYNAYQEKSDGRFVSQFNSAIPIYADSGGLQMVTRYNTSTKLINGVKTKVHSRIVSTKEMREKVFDSQIESSNFAMSFDEIPKITVKRGTTEEVEPWYKGDTDKVFIREKLGESAEKSGQNLKEQIDYFKSKNVDPSKTKILLIAQGYSLDSYQKWTDTLLSYLSEEDLGYIGGMAIGAAGLMGILTASSLVQDIKKFFIASKLEVPDILRKHHHHLGIGASIRLIPMIPFIKNGMMKDILVSYDSSTHSSWINYGHFLLEDGSRFSKINTHSNPLIMTERIYDSFVKNIHKTPVSKEDFSAVCMRGNNSTKLVEEGISKKTQNIANVMYILTAIYNHIVTTQRCFEEESFLEDYLDKYFSKGKQLSVFYALKQLEGVFTLREFEQWEKDYHKYITKIPPHVHSQITNANHNLTDLFV